MSDEISDSNQTIPDGFDSWNAYWEAQNMPWRTEPEIDAERQAYLAKRRAVEPDIAHGLYPFRDANGPIKLNRADVEWLLATHDNGRGPVEYRDDVSGMRRGLDVRGADLRGVNLRRLPLIRLLAGLVAEDREKTTKSQWETAGARLEGAHLYASDLRLSCLAAAHLEGADLTRTRLESAYLGHAHLEACTLLEAVLDKGTFLEGAHLDRVILDQVILDETNLAVVNWDGVHILGDELVARSFRTAKQRSADEPSKTDKYIAAVRAYRHLAVRFREQGMTEEGDRFAYRAQVLQRVVFTRQRRYGKWLFSLLLALLSGYGYRLGRVILAYGLFVGLFALLYLFLSSGCAIGSAPQVFVSAAHCAPTGHTYTWVEAVVISVTAFHGRVFAESYQPGTPFGIVAAVEAVVGLVIEGVFIALLTQRFFSR